MKAILKGTLMLACVIAFFCFCRAPAEETAPAPAVAPTNAGLEPFDRLMTSFLSWHDVPGASLAVVRNGRLVMARGYGWADVERKRPVESTSLFRIASLSKPITAVAVLTLVEAQKLALDAKPFLLLDGKPPARHPAPRLPDITVLHLLQHTGGFDRSKSFDPMFRSFDIARELHESQPATPDMIIRYMMSRALDFAPGGRYAYSNYGYCVLGRVIEKVSGVSYEQYVRERVLARLGIRDMRIGKTLPEGRAENEVVYYDHDPGTEPAVVGPIGQSVPRPYGAWYLEAMDSHGGWIASAVDMARFASAFDESSPVKILCLETVRTMFARPAGLAGFEGDGQPKAAYYGCGWMVRPTPDGRANQWHSGELPGCSALMVRRHDGLAWAVLFNKRAGRDGIALPNAIDPLLHIAADSVTAWPAVDLFERAK
jgi:N-acyl-D-amino-acid deacylase